VSPEREREVERAREALAENDDEPGADTGAGQSERNDRGPDAQSVQAERMRLDEKTEGRSNQ